VWALGDYESADRRLSAMLEPAAHGGRRYPRLKAEHTAEIRGVLDEWGVETEYGPLDYVRAGLPLFHVAEMAALVVGVPDWRRSLDQTVGAWVDEQRARGWGVLVRGNPLPPQRPSMELYATRYADVAFDAARPGWVLHEPRGGWRDSREVAEASAAGLAVKQHPWAVAALVGVTLAAGVTLALLMRD
jgi:hypothetical protein